MFRNHRAAKECFPKSEPMIILPKIREDDQALKVNYIDFLIIDISLKFAL